MEAIVTLALVCNVMQVISFTGEVFRGARSFHGGGSPDTDLVPNMKTLNELLSSMTTRLDDFDAIGLPNNTAQQQQQ
ncbi:hypothetical protein M426DRAFT_16567 [Hypoxylon sp. CI-4A]|nr:hypothetical protein M426DRAFT_16567 [Hypoxylon sp. CI-4A]